MAHSTPRPSGAKSPPKKSGYTRTTPKKPPFPLWLHAGSRQWAKKIQGRCYYFGTDQDAALAEYMRTKDDLEAGRVPLPPDSVRVTLLKAVQVFLTHKTHQLSAGEIGQRSFDSYYDSCEALLKHFGKTVFVDQLRPSDLLGYRHKLAETRNATSIANEVTRVRSVFHFAFRNRLIERPVQFGEFTRPTKRVLRKVRTEKQKAAPRMFEPAELRKVIDKAGDQLKAMTLLGVNCGFGNTDVSFLPISAIDLAGGWINFPRPKTGVDRRCPLWPETLKAIQAVIAKRHSPADPDHADVLFISKRRKPWATGTRGASGITHEFRKVLDDLEIYRPGLSFYTLRHVFQTIADETGDYLATRRIMGHSDNSISDAYRERFPDERLKKVSDHVHTWLFGEGAAS